VLNILNKGSEPTVLREPTVLLYRLAKKPDQKLIKQVLDTASGVGSICSQGLANISGVGRGNSWKR
jgi:hypothetical protein